MAAVALLVVGALLAGYWTMRTQDASTGALCTQLYRQARTRIDTLGVDAQVPIISKSDALTSLSCGTLRARGRLN